MPCGTVRLLDHVVAARRGDHLLVIDTDETRYLPDRGPVTSELIGTYCVWDVVFSQKPHHEVLGGPGIAVPLKQHIEHKPVLVDCPPQPVSNPLHRRADLLQKPPGTPPGFPVTQAICEEWAELDGPFAKGLVTDLDAAPVQQFLHVPVTQGKAVVEADGVLDDDHGETVAVRLGVGHGQSAYPDPIKATQPFLDVSGGEREAVGQPDSVLDDRHGKTVEVGFGIGHGGSGYPDPMIATQPTEPFQARQKTPERSCGAL